MMGKGAHRSSCGRRKRIERPNAKVFEVANVPGHDRQAVHHGGRRNHRILDEIVCLPVHETRPGAEYAGIHRQDVVGLGDLIEPSFDLDCFGQVLLAGDLDTCLQLADGHGGKMNLRIGYIA